MRRREAGTRINSLQSRVQQLYFRSRQGVTGRQNLGTRSTVHIYCIVKEIYQEKDKDMDRKCLYTVYETTTELVTVCARTSRRCVDSVLYHTVSCLSVTNQNPLPTGILQTMSLGSSSPLGGSTTFAQLLDLYKLEECKGWWVCMVAMVTLAPNSLRFALLHLKNLNFLPQDLLLKTITCLWRNRDASVTGTLTIQLHHHQAEASSVDPGLSLRFQAFNNIKNTQKSVTFQPDDGYIPSPKNSPTWTSCRHED